jgi:uncharacterized membrane protein
MESEEAPRVRGLARAAAAVAMLELALALWAAWIALSVGGACPASGGAFSCEAIFRPKLASLMGIPIAKVGLIGAIASLASAVLLTKTKPSGGFSRATAFGALSGAAFAIGVQPLSWIGAGAVCPVCLGIVICAVVFAVLATSIAIKMKKDVLLAMLFAVCVGGMIGWRATEEGRRTREQSEATLVQLDETREISLRPSDGAMRLLLVERRSCPFCRAVKVDVLADPTFQEACRRAGICEIGVLDEADAVKAGFHVGRVPTIFLQNEHGDPITSIEGYYPDLEPYLELLEKAKKR